MKRSYRMKKRSLAAASMVFFTAACFAQESVSTKEAGAYQRKSVAFLNATVNKYENVTIPELWQESFTTSLQNSVRSKRFDYNDIPKDITDKFSALPASLSVEERMNIAVVPAVLAAVDAEKEIRAVQLLSEQQKNSFIVDKAKELGINEEDIKAVMNAAYIFAPIYSGYTDTSYVEQYTYTHYYKDANGYQQRETRTATRNVYQLNLTGGGYWWKIDNTSEKPTVKILAPIEKTFSGKSYPDSTAKYPQGYQYGAFRSALGGISTAVTNATVEIADFQYTGQILNKNPRNVVISLGRPEEISVDDKFRVYESREDANGNVTQKKAGWVMVKKVGEKAKGLDSTQSKAQIISGIPYVGAVVREIPHFPFDIYVGFGMTPFSIADKEQNKKQEEFKKKREQLKNDWIEDDKDTLSENFRRAVNGLKDDILYDIQGLKFSNMYGPEIRYRQNLFRLLGGESGSQWWLNAGGKFLFNPSAGGTLRYHHEMDDENWGQNSSWYSSYEEKIEYKIGGVWGFEAGASFTKKVFIRRLALAPELGFGVKMLGLSGLEELDKDGKKVKADDQTYDLIVYGPLSLGLVSNMGVEIAFAPNFHLGGSVGYHLFTPDNGWASSWRYYDGEDNKAEYKDGPKISVGDKVKTIGMTWSAYVSWTIPNSSANQRMKF